MKSEKIKHNSAKRLDDVFHLSRCKKKESLYYLSNFLYLLAKPGRVEQSAFICFRTKRKLIFFLNKTNNCFSCVFLLFLFGFVPNLTCLKTAYFLQKRHDITFLILYLND